jgi:hypothetical protein
MARSDFLPLNISEKDEILDILLQVLVVVGHQIMPALHFNELPQGDFLLLHFSVLVNQEPLGMCLTEQHVQPAVKDMHGALADVLKALDHHVVLVVLE